MATDISDPIVIATVVQTAVLALTMIIFIFQFRSQNIAIKDAAYQKALDDYTNQISLLVQKPELAPMMEELAEISRATKQGVEKVTQENSAGFAYMLLSYSLFERIYLLYSKKWIDEETWMQWHTWLKTMAKHQMFQQVHKRSEGTFDRAFQKLVDDASKFG